MHLQVKIDTCLSIIVKKVNGKKNSGDEIGMILTARSCREAKEFLIWGGLMNLHCAQGNCYTEIFLWKDATN